MKRLNPAFIICLALLLLIFGLSLALRISVPWNEVFTGSGTKLTDNDAYFYARLLDNLSAHFPSMINFDPYYVYPGGKDLGGQPLFSVYFMGFFAWLLGGGAPSQQLVDQVAVYFPAVMGALLVFPVFFITAAIINRWAGLAAAILVTLMPGSFLSRTLLGNPDSHVVEIFFTTLFMLFLLLAAQKGSSMQFIPLQKSARRDKAVFLTFALLAGLFLGLYILSWSGALLFVAISLVWLAIQFISDHLRKKNTLYLGITGCTVYLPALLISLFDWPGLLTITILAICIFVSLALAVLSFFMQKHGLKPVNFLYAVLALAAVSVTAVFIVMPQITSALQATLAELTGKSIGEIRPLLIPEGEFTLAPLWGHYTAASLLALAGLIIACYKAVKEGTAGMLMLVVWSITILILTLAMRRFAYYLAVDVAILSGITCWLILQACGFKTPQKDAPATAKVKAEAVKSRSKHSKTAARAASPGLMAIGVIAVVALTVYPNTGPLPGGDRPFSDVATKGLFTPSNAWCESLTWLREKSPEPFSDAAYYYDQYKNERRQAGYSVLTWWDYGYWVTRMGHRVPVCNPGDQLKGEQKYFTTQKASEAAETSAGWKLKYVVIDDYMINWRSGFKAMANAAGNLSNSYYEIYYRQQNDGLTQALLYYPEYYKTMCVRLYCFDGKQYDPQETAVVCWEMRSGADGKPYKLITGLKTFRTYSDASDFAAAQKTGNWRIVGKDPLVSPVPLDEVKGYKLAYGSSQTTKYSNNEIPSVKIFEYTAGANEK